MDLSPVTTPAPPDTNSFTPERRARFLAQLARHGNVRSACRAIGISREAVYRLRRRDEVFARGWAAAVILGRDASEQVLADRAIDGVEEEIYYRGELVGTRRRYDSRLLLAHIARLDAMAEDKEAREDAERFDELLHAIATGEEDDPLPEPEDVARRAGIAAAETHREEALTRRFSEDGEPLDEPYVMTDEQVDEMFGDDADDYRTDLQEACFEADMNAREDVFRGWDARIAAIHAAVDELCPVEGFCDPAAPGRSDLLCTVSTVSTCGVSGSLPDAIGPVINPD